MNEKCKYCDYVSECSRICEYNSILCKINRSFPKVVDKSYEQLQQENKQLQQQRKKQKEVIDKVMNLIKKYGKYDGEKCTQGFQMWSADFNKILDILKEVSE